MKYIIDIQSEGLKEAGEQGTRTIREKRHSFSLIHSQLMIVTSSTSTSQRNTHFLSWHKILKGSYFISETILFLLVIYLIINWSTATSPVFVWYPLFAGYWTYGCSPRCRLIRNLIWVVMRGPA